MFVRNYFFRFLFHSACSYITLLAFVLTSIIPLYSYSTEESGIHKGVIKNLDPRKKMKKLEKLVKKLENFDEKTSFHDLSDFMNSLKKFTEKEIGRKISIDDLVFEVNKQLNELNIPLDSKIVKSCLSRLLDKKGMYKSIQSNGPKEAGEEINAYMILGCVLVASSTLIAAIGFAVPPLAPYCYTTARFVGGLGVTSILTGICEQDKNRKSIFIGKFR